MEEKEYKFEDGSSFKVSILDSGEISFQIRARHIGQGSKFTSTSLTLTNEESINFIEWLFVKANEEVQNDKLG